MFLYSSWGPHSKYAGAVCHSLRQGIMFCQNSPLWPLHLGRPYTAWLMASLSFASPFAMTRQCPWRGREARCAAVHRVAKSQQLGEWKTKMTTTTITKLYITSQEFTSLMTESLYRLTDIYLCPPTPKPMATTILLSTSMSFMFWDATYKWDHTVFVFLWLISLSIMSSRLIHVITSGRIPLIFWLNNIPLYLHITFSLSILPLMDFRLFQYLGYCEKCYFPRRRREEHEI